MLHGSRCWCALAGMVHWRPGFSLHRLFRSWAGMLWVSDNLFFMLPNAVLFFVVWARFSWWAVVSGHWFRITLSSAFAFVGESSVCRFGRATHRLRRLLHPLSPFFGVAHMCSDSLSCR